MKTEFSFSVGLCSGARRRETAVSICIALALLANPLARTQVTSGDLVGVVADPTGGAVPGAQVDVVEESTGVRASKTTEANGQYRFSNLHIGKYDLVVNAAGFTQTSLKGVAIELNKTATQNVTLAVGQLSQSVEVVEATETIDTSTAQIQSNFTAKLAADLPVASLANGGVLNLSLLGAGVANAGGVGVGEGPSVGGQRPTTTTSPLRASTTTRRVRDGSVDIRP